MKTEELFHQWSIGIRDAHVRHRMAAGHYGKLHRIMGAIVVIATALVGTTLFATLGSSKNMTVQIGIGCVSVAAAVLSALQTFLNYPELSEKHKIAAVKYGELRRELDQALVSPPANDEELSKFLTTFRTRWDVIDQEAPSVPSRIISTARTAIKQSEQRMSQKTTEGTTLPPNNDGL